jgi:hypothetical protein
MAARANHGSLGDADISTNCDFLVVNKPNFFTNPAVVTNFKVPREVDSNPAAN